MTKKRIKRMMKTLLKWQQELYADYTEEEKQETQMYMSLSTHAFPKEEGGPVVNITWRARKGKKYNDAYILKGKLYAEDLEK